MIADTCKPQLIEPYFTALWKPVVAGRLVSFLRVQYAQHHVLTAAYIRVSYDDDRITLCVGSIEWLRAWIPLRVAGLFRIHQVLQHDVHLIGRRPNDICACRTI